MMTMDNPNPEVTDEDAYLEFCADNLLDPDSRRAQKIWAEQLDYLNGS